MFILLALLVIRTGLRRDHSLGLFLSDLFRRYLRSRRGSCRIKHESLLKRKERTFHAGRCRWISLVFP